ncbi:MAG: mlaB [Gammaproteobacteria bacterium]|jgi:phospholipid transport system transporter-binding protein|nr:mlaB [Gammaproteobacteria bacterium]
MVEATVALSPNGLALEVTGVLDVQTVPGLVGKANGFIHEVADPVFDLAGVTKAESSALALLMAWHRQSHGLGKAARFVHVPKNLMAIATLSNLESVLKLG